MAWGTESAHLLYALAAAGSDSTSPSPDIFPSRTSYLISCAAVSRGSCTLHVGGALVPTGCRYRGRLRPIRPAPPPPPYLLSAPAPASRCPLRPPQSSPSS
jgi:hypothetical protein